MKYRLFAMLGLTAVALSSVVVSPANATTIDAGGVTLNFANAGDVDVFTDAATGDTYTYTNVATVDGQRIDAVLTVGAVSADIVNTYTYEKFGTTEVDLLNALNADPEADLTPGCYSNAAYVASIDNMTFDYELADFVASDRLEDGHITAVDAYQGDSTDSAINNSVDICTHYNYPSAVSSMEITIDFEVGGSPVTLTNVVLNVQDIDGGQSVKFSAPKPSSYTLTDKSALVVTNDASFTKFYGEDSADDDPNYAADVHYDSISSLTYEFAFEEGSGGGSLSVMFEPFVAELEGLAPTGANDTVPGMVLFLAFVTVAVGVSLRRHSITRR